MQTPLHPDRRRGVGAASRGIALSLAATLVITSGWGSAAMAATAATDDDTLQFYGLVGTYIGSIKRSDAVARTSVVGSGGLTTSYVGFRGAQDLGNGTSAIFQLESFFQPDTGGAGRSASDPGGFSRTGWVGLRGHYGQLTMGRHTAPYYVAMLDLNPFQGSVVFSPLVVQTYVATYNNIVIGDTVWSNGIEYMSPEVGGLSVTALHAPGEVAGHGAVANDTLSLRYATGRLLASVTAQRVRTAAVAPSTGQDALLAGLRYDTTVATLYAAAQATSNAVTGIRARTAELGTSVPVSAAGAVKWSWARTSVDNPKGPAPSHDTAALGYDHLLSKRTNVYAVWLADHNAGRPSGHSLILGIRHLF